MHVTIINDVVEIIKVPLSRKSLPEMTGKKTKRLEAAKTPCKDAFPGNDNFSQPFKENLIGTEKQTVT